MGKGREEKLRLVGINLDLKKSTVLILLSNFDWLKYHNFIQHFYHNNSNITFHNYRFSSWRDESTIMPRASPALGLRTYYIRMLTHSWSDRALNSVLDIRAHSILTCPTSWNIVTNETGSIERWSILLTKRVTSSRCVYRSQAFTVLNFPPPHEDRRIFAAFFGSAMT